MPAPAPVMMAVLPFKENNGRTGALASEGVGGVVYVYFEHQGSNFHGKAFYDLRCLRRRRRSKLSRRPWHLNSKGELLEDGRKVTGSTNTTPRLETHDSGVRRSI